MVITSTHNQLCLWRIRGLSFLSLALFITWDFRSSCSHEFIFDPAWGLIDLFTNYEFSKSIYYEPMFYLISILMIPYTWFVVFPQKLSKLAFIMAAISSLVSLFVIFGHTSNEIKLYGLLMLVCQLLLTYIISDLHYKDRVSFTSTWKTILILIIYALILAVATPNVHRASHAANEAHAVGTVRDIQQCAQFYKSKHPIDGFPKENSQLTTLGCDMGLWKRNPDNGYAVVYEPVFSIDHRSVSGFRIYISPYLKNDPCKGGSRSFYGDETGLITYTAEPRPAYATDKPL